MNSRRKVFRVPREEYEFILDRLQGIKELVEVIDSDTQHMAELNPKKQVLKSEIKYIIQKIDNL